MTKETKIGLLVGIGMILFICILVSDMLSGEEPAEPTDLTGRGGAGRSVEPADGSDWAAPTPGPGLGGERGPLAGSSTPIPEPGAGDDGSRSGGVASSGADASSSTSSSSSPRSRGPLGGHSLSQTGDFRPNILINSTDDPETDRDDRRDGFVSHHVKAGESPWSIAEEHYGDGRYHELIYEHNRDKMPSPETVREGVMLRIPKLREAEGERETGGNTRANAASGRSSGRSSDRASTEGSSARSDGSARASATVEYTIQSGDTFLELAQRFYGTVQAADRLLELNRGRIDDPDRLRVGQKIRVPADGGR